MVSVGRVQSYLLQPERSSRWAYLPSSSSPAVKASSFLGFAWDRLHAANAASARLPGSFGIRGSEPDLRQPLLWQPQSVGRGHSAVGLDRATGGAASSGSGGAVSYPGIISSPFLIAPPQPPPWQLASWAKAGPGAVAAWRIEEGAEGEDGDVHVSGEDEEQWEEPHHLLPMFPECIALLSEATYTWAPVRSPCSWMGGLRVLGLASVYACYECASLQEQD